VHRAASAALHSAGSVWPLIRLTSTSCRGMASLSGCRAAEQTLFARRQSERCVCAVVLRCGGQISHMLCRQATGDSGRNPEAVPALILARASHSTRSHLGARCCARFTSGMRPHHSCRIIGRSKPHLHTPYTHHAPNSLLIQLRRPWQCVWLLQPPWHVGGVIIRSGATHHQ
jgi:hypothetical protein